MLEEALLELTTEPATERATDCGVANRELIRSASMAGFYLSIYDWKLGVFILSSVPKKAKKAVCFWMKNICDCSWDASACQKMWPRIVWP